MPDAAAMYALVAGAISALCTWAVTRRQMSGSVATTNADRLWAQNEALIKVLQTDNNHLRDRLQQQDQRIAKQEEKLWELTTRERECAQVSADQARKIERLERMLKVDIGASTESDISASLSA